MSASDWQEGNSRYLAASLQWLRLRLLQLDRSDAEPAPTTVASAPPVARRSWLFRGLHGGSHFAPQAPAAAARPAAGLRPGDLAAATERRAAAAQIDPPPALLLLSRRLGLDEFERDTLLLCIAAELDPGMGELLAGLQGSAGRAYPTFGLALRLFEQPSWDALSPHRPLRYARLLEINQPGATPLTASALRADERIVNYIKGLNAVDERIAALATPLDQGLAEQLSPSQQALAEELVQQLRVHAAEGALQAVQLLGVDGGSKQAVACRACAALGLRPYRLGLDALPTHKAELENLARLWQRESLLLPLALYIEAESLDSAAADLGAALQGFAGHDLGLVFVGLREAPARWSGGGAVFEVAKPGMLEQCQAWRELLQIGAAGADAAGAAQQLAGQFDLNLHDIRQAAELAVRGEAAAVPVGTRAWDACRNLTRPRLDVLAQRLDPKATWSDLVLSEESLGLLRQIAGQVRERYRVYEGWGYGKRMNRGLGISALFAGESGTGKTMAAEVIANELRLNLYRIDLSAVVSKYIGETEKNLRRLFDAAEQGGAILLFDEADALFGKRSEVKDSHDRYANIEINYLLQRMEAYSGLAILATNMKSALDAAFLRRLRFIVNFQFPGAAERRQMWQKAWPAEVPLEALDYDRLARFSLSGGNVHSIALNAAFLASQRGSVVTMPLLLSAVRTELRKLDKPVNEAEFR